MNLHNLPQHSWICKFGCTCRRRKRSCELKLSLFVSDLAQKGLRRERIPTISVKGCLHLERMGELCSLLTYYRNSSKIEVSMKKARRINTQTVALTRMLFSFFLICSYVICSSSCLLLEPKEVV